MLANRIRNAVDRYRAIRRAQQLKNRFQKIFEQSNDAIMLIDPAEGAILDVNRQACQMLGYNYDELCSLTPADIHSDGIDQFRKFIDSVYEEGTGWTDELSYLRKDGTALPAEISASVIELDDRRQILAFIRDITDRKQHEEKLELFRDLLDQSTDEVYIVDPATGDFLDVNDTACRNLGYDRDELLEMNVQDIDYSGVTDPWDEHVDRVRTEASVKEEIIHERKDGTTYPVEMNVDHVVIDDEAFLLAIIRDISDRKKREHKLQTQQHRLETLLTNIPVILWEINTDGVFTQSRGNALEKLDLEPDEVVGESVFEVYADHSEILDYCKRALDGESTATTVEIEDLVLESWFQPVRDKTGEVTRVVTIAYDITERTKREQKLHETTERLEAIIEASPDPIVTVDTNGVVEQWNPAAEQVFGYSADEIIGESLLSTPIIPTGSEIFENKFESVLEGESFTGIEVQRRTVDDEMIDLRVSVAPIRNKDNSVTGMVSVLRDITEHKERKRELQQIKERFQRVFEQSNDAIMIVDMENEEFVEVNQAACELLNYTCEELLTLNPEDIHPDDIDRVREEFISEVYETGSGWTDELSCVTKHGKEVPTEISGATLQLNSDQGPPSKMVAILRDVSDRIDYEQELKQQKQALERQNERLEKFASIVSHDLRTPLSLAEGYLKLLRETDDEEVIDDIEDAHERMRTIINDVLTVARKGQTVEERKPIELSDLIVNAWEAVESTGATLQIGDIECQVMADEDRLCRVFENLFRNAIEHAGQDVTIEVNQLSDAEGIYIADDGPGIPEKKREEVFEWGYSTTDEGTGYGLAIVSDLIEAHGWRVTVTESKSGGARFEISEVDTTTSVSDTK